MKNLVLIVAMLGLLALALGWMAFTGFGARTSDAPPVVVDYGAQHQTLNSSLQAPEVSLRAEPYHPVAVAKTAAAPPRLKGSHKARPAARRTPPVIVVKAIPQPTASKPIVAHAPPRKGVESPDRRIAKLEPPAHYVPSIPPPEHYAPRLDSSDSGVREIPISVRRESPPGPTEKELEANREWRRKILDKWAREESRSLSQGIRQQQATRAKGGSIKPKRTKPAAKPRRRHRLLFITW